MRIPFLTRSRASIPSPAKARTMSQGPAPTLVNRVTGMGVSGMDKSVGAEFAFQGGGNYNSGGSYAMWRNLYRTSWAARKIVRLIVDDAMSTWREFTGDDETTADAMMAAEKRHKVINRMSKALLGSRLYGGGGLVMMTEEAPLEEPLDVDRIRPGDLKSLLPRTRYQLRPLDRSRDPFDPGFERGSLYSVDGESSQSLQIHSSRILLMGSGDDLGSGYDGDWGDSILLHSFDAIMQEIQARAGSAHLTQEASLLVVKMQAMRDVLDGTTDETLEDMGAQLNSQISIYRKILTGPEDVIERLSVSWGGLGDVLDRFPKTIAASQDIPLTRFMGQSPAGQNATGQSDWNNWADSVDSYMRMEIAPHLDTLDMVLARDAGLSESPPYKWQSLMDPTERDKAEVAVLYTQAGRNILDGGYGDEEEVRAWIAKQVNMPNFDPNWVAPEPEPYPGSPLPS